MTFETKKIFNSSVFSSSISVVISLSLVLFIVGTLFLVLINAQKLSNYVKENIGFSVMLEENTSELECLRFLKEIDANNFSKSVTLISKEQATKELRDELGEDFVDFLGYSPLLSSIDVKLNANYANSDSLIKIKNQLNKNTNVFEVYYQEDLVKKINSNVNRIAVFLLGFCLLLLIIAFVLINNTIRLSVYSKRFLIRTMRLVGARNSFIQKPFLINGLYQGLYGAIFAVFMLIGSLQLIQKEAMNILNISDLKIIGTVFLLIFIFGVFISWISTYLSVKKYIKLTENKLYK
jgi:cell division transport system permease protein|tara:strand:+ start:11532 stop:12410 length:879 start_codon:yes stop_codon:yes gene_type:complete